MKHYRKVFRKILLLLITIPVSFFIFSANSLAFLCKFINTGGIIYDPSTLDPLTVHPAKLPGYFLPQPVCIYRATHFCHFFTELDENWFICNCHLYCNWELGGLCIGAHTI